MPGNKYPDICEGGFPRMVLGGVAVSEVASSPAETPAKGVYVRRRTLKNPHSEPLSRSAGVAGIPIHMTLLGFQC